MPGFHIHLPPEEDERMPDDEEIIIIEEDIVEPSENEDEGRVCFVSSDDDEASEDEDDGNDIWAIFHEITTQPWVPNGSSGEEDEYEAGGFWTPPSTMEDDFEEVVTRNTARRGLRRPNTAIRSRVSRPSVYAARRGRYRQPVAEQEFYQHSAFDRGLTFNGFARDLEPEKIVGHQLIGNQRDLLYSVKWRDMEEAKLIESSVMNAYRSDLIVDYYETKVKEEF